VHFFPEVSGLNVAFKGEPIGWPAPLIPSNAEIVSKTLLASTFDGYPDTEKFTIGRPKAGGWSTLP
jgi:hypothetical protein